MQIGQALLDMPTSRGLSPCVHCCNSIIQYIFIEKFVLFYSECKLDKFSWTCLHREGCLLFLLRSPSLPSDYNTSPSPPPLNPLNAPLLCPRRIDYIKRGWYCFCGYRAITVHFYLFVVLAACPPALWCIYLSFYILSILCQYVRK